MERALPGLTYQETDSFLGFAKLRATNVSDLLNLQSQIWAYEVYVPTRPHEFHLTLLGANPGLVYQRLKDCGGCVGSYEDFRDAMIDVAAARSTVNIEGLVVYGESLAIFGDALNPVIALKVIKTVQIEELRKPFEERFQELLRSCGISDPEDFMDSDPKLKYHLKRYYQPHITLGRVHVKPKDANFLALDVAGLPVHLEHKPSFHGFERIIWSSKEPVKDAPELLTLENSTPD